MERLKCQRASNVDRARVDLAPMHCAIRVWRNSLCCHERPYHVDSTKRRSLCEVKQRRSRLVLQWGIIWEALVLFFVTTHPLHDCFQSIRSAILPQVCS